MKHKIVLLFFVLLILSSFLASARDLLVPSQGTKQGEKVQKVSDNILGHAYAADLRDDMDELTDSKKCNENDEECLTRRMIAEAHLDYIYTEHHNP
ncbi:hypothetical protein TanjilG_19770 [Lupinus angustifolius]|uniref:putative phytosulfokines 6 n=1 Tax=Lupinus angustifolius TaxID=3871 RepID=UPI00090DFB14|nr:PREDICTED: putative phytosulfokines 6 [Lupinus angustifolius]OIV90361.1 hypothetical protein TanjilG_19770 [Lupinus angustifolius]